MISSDFLLGKKGPQTLHGVAFREPAPFFKELHELLVYLAYNITPLGYDHVLGARRRVKREEVKASCNKSATEVIDVSLEHLPAVAQAHGDAVTTDQAFVMLVCDNASLDDVVRGFIHKARNVRSQE